MPSFKKSKSSKPKVVKTAKTGVDKIINALIANRSKIGALVIHAMALPGQKLALDQDNKEATGQRGMLSADTITAEDDEERGSINIGSVITQGMAVDIHKRLMQERRGGMFG